MERQIAKLVQALKDGIPASVVREELIELERRKVALASRPTVSPRPLLHPHMADVYREKVLGLREAHPAGQPYEGSRSTAWVCG